MYVLIPEDKFSPHLSPRKLFFVTDAGHCRKSESIKMENCGSQFQLINLQHNFSTKGSGIIVEEGAGLF